MPPFQEKCFPATWLKAFMVSPGVLFPAAYLVLYLSVSAFLNTGFKKELCQSYSVATHDSRRLSIGSLKAGPDLCSVKITGIESTPAQASLNKGTRSIRTVDVNLSGIAGFMFSRSARELFIHEACRKILAEESLPQ